MKEIKLTQNKVALVDDEDFDELNKFKWHVTKNGKSFYAARVIYPNGSYERKVKIYMHRQILKLENSSLHVDHKDRDSLNNQKDNLRGCTQKENNSNMNRTNCSSKYKGVSYSKHTEKWRAVIFIEKKQSHLGYFLTEEEAARAYDKKAKTIHGEFAYLNFN